MEMGADIITEKPLTTDETKCQAILNAEKRTGKTVRVTFNYRYSPHRVKIYELLRSNAIGKITSVDFHWYLNTSHGQITSDACIAYEKKEDLCLSTRHPIISTF